VGFTPYRESIRQGFDRMTSQTDKLLSNIREYTGLLELLNERHPQVLKEWEVHQNEK
jgi:hypothetical protein